MPRPQHSPRQQRPFRAVAVAAAFTVMLALASAVATAPARAAETRQAPSGQDVTIIEGEERTVYEYRRNGELRMVKIVPDVGRPYYLVPADDTRGFGDLEQADMLVPRWILFEF